MSGYIEGLDGLRALAVGLVIAYHLWPSRLPGGFIGVDVFFVISGFLITTLLVREQSRTSRIDLVAFWRRRARRLLPPLLAVLFAVLLVARALDGDLLVGIGRQTAGALTFSSNWLEIAADADYFNHTSPQLLSMLWSLAVEEQFYLFWPLVVLALTAFTRSHAARLQLVLAAAGVSAVLMAVRTTSAPNMTRVYYGTDTHMFGLMIGAALAFAMSGDLGMLARRRWLHLRRWVGVAATAGVVGLAFVLESSAAITYRGGLLLASVLSAIAIACLPGPPSAFTRVLSLPPLAWVGRRSYGIYLWHWPIILFVVAAQDQPYGLELDWRSSVLAIVITLVIAEASWTRLEQPIQRDGFGIVWQRVSEPRVYVPALSAVIAATCIVWTAPDRSAVQAAVEDGTRLIEQQEASVAVSPATSVAPTGSAVETAPPPVADTSASTVPPSSAPATPTTAPVVATTEPTAAVPDWWPAGQAVPPGTSMIGLGDSVMSGGAQAIYNDFPGIVLDARPNRQWTDVPDLIRQAKDNGSIRPVVVLNFGSNAGLRGDRQMAAFREALDLLGPERRVVLINLFSPSSFVADSNAALAAAAAERPNVVVADWHSAVAGHGEYLYGDATHPNMKGVYVYTEVIRQALEQLGSGT